MYGVFSWYIHFIYSHVLVFERLKWQKVTTYILGDVLMCDCVSLFLSSLVAPSLLMFEMFALNQDLDGVMVSPFTTHPRVSLYASPHPP
jgi:hypothetical protein